MGTLAAGRSRVRDQIRVLKWSSVIDVARKGTMRGFVRAREAQNCDQNHDPLPEMFAISAGSEVITLSSAHKTFKEAVKTVQNLMIGDNMRLKGSLGKDMNVKNQDHGVMTKIAIKTEFLDAKVTTEKN